MTSEVVAIEQPDLAFDIPTFPPSIINRSGKQSSREDVSDVSDRVCGAKLEILWYYGLRIGSKQQAAIRLDDMEFDWIGRLVDAGAGKRDCLRDPSLCQNSFNSRMKPADEYADVCECEGCSVSWPIIWRCVIAAKVRVVGVLMLAADSGRWSFDQSTMRFDNQQWRTVSTSCTMVLHVDAIQVRIRRGKKRRWTCSRITGNVEIGKAPGVPGDFLSGPL